MKKYLLITSVLFSIGCVDDVVIVQDSPAAPSVIVDEVSKCMVTGNYVGNLKSLVCALRGFNQHEELRVIVLAQWILESGWGKSELSKKYFNYGGLKWRDEMIGHGTPVLYNAHDGETEYVEFISPAAYIRGYWAFIGRHRYVGWHKYKNNPEKYLRFIVKAGYCPDNGYVDKVISLMPKARSMLED